MLNINVYLQRRKPIRKIYNLFIILCPDWSFTIELVLQNKISLSSQSYSQISAKTNVLCLWLFFFLFIIRVAFKKNKKANSKKLSKCEVLFRSDLSDKLSYLKFTKSIKYQKIYQNKC